MSEMYPEEPPPSAGRKWGKSAWVAGQVDHALANGDHVHANSVMGEHCMGGDPECPLYEHQLMEALEAWE